MREEEEDLCLREVEDFVRLRSGEREREREGETLLERERERGRERSDTGEGERAFFGATGGFHSGGVSWFANGLSHGVNPPLRISSSPQWLMVTS